MGAATVSDLYDGVEPITGAGVLARELGGVEEVDEEGKLRGAMKHAKSGEAASGLCLDILAILPRSPRSTHSPPLHICCYHMRPIKWH